ncbi:heavy metal-binding domain-containing protein [Flavobacterium sp. CHNK8]|uniref:heavy metal-binding domain-containing protein n=1 Tax=Flavobacterium sp. CHNK8 TaxID=2871165 RepID=UPI002104C447|nr:heavy metal-binding domain-containing protein [Flavobacterium sp. CHNK8]
MKNVILTAVVLALVTISCNQKSKEATTTENEIVVTDTTVITNDGTSTDSNTVLIEKDTVFVKETTKKEVATKIFSCPMHPEVQGELNSECSKCGMPLTETVM